MVPSPPGIDDLPTPSDIAEAAARVGPHVRRTPVIAVGADVTGGPGATLKLELLQHTGSFKPRGAFNCVLSADVPDAGIIAASGGNHGAAVAHVGAELGLPTEVFVPEAAPAIKLERLNDYPARVTRAGALYDDAQAASTERAAVTGALVVHPYDLAAVIAGQGTMTAEIEAQVEPLDTIVVAVGGGGLMAGAACWLRGRVKIVAVEPERSRCLGAALAAGEPVDVPVSGLASDSLGAKRIGSLAFAAASTWVEETVTVPDEAIASAQQAMWDRMRLIVEPGGAAALAAIRSGAYSPAPDERVVVVVCGANTDPSSIIDRPVS